MHGAVIMFAHHSSYKGLTVTVPNIQPRSYTMDTFSLVDMTTVEVEASNVADLFEAPTKYTSRKNTHVRHHTIFTVDTTLNRKDRICKPSVRNKEYGFDGGKRGANARSRTVCPATDPSHLLWCDEGSSFLFRPLHPDVSDKSAKGVLPDDPDNLDTEEYDELQLIYESVHLSSC